MKTVIIVPGLQLLLAFRLVLLDTFEQFLRQWVGREFILVDVSISKGLFRASSVGRTYRYGNIPDLRVGSLLGECSTALNGVLGPEERPTAFDHDRHLLCAAH